MDSFDALRIITCFRVVSKGNQKDSHHLGGPLFLRHPPLLENIIPSFSVACSSGSYWAGTWGTFALAWGRFWRRSWGPLGTSGFEHSASLQLVQLVLWIGLVVKVGCPIYFQKFCTKLGPQSRQEAGVPSPTTWEVCRHPFLEESLDLPR